MQPEQEPLLVSSALWLIESKGPPSMIYLYPNRIYGLEKFTLMQREIYK